MRNEEGEQVERNDKEGKEQVEQREIDRERERERGGGHRRRKCTCALLACMFDS